MISNTPWNRSRAAKRRLYRDHPDDLLPSSTGALAAHLGTVIEFTLPLILLVSAGRDDRDDRRRRDDRLPPPHPLDVPARGAAGVEHLHDLRAAVPLRALRRHLVLDPRRTAPDRDPRRHLRRLPGPRQLPPRPRLVPALDALLRRQLGDEPVAVPARGGGAARPRRWSSRRRPSASSSRSSTTRS